VVLESRAHALLSGRLLLLAYRGRRSARDFRIPLRYARTPDGTLVAVAVQPERKQWWRTFSGGADASLTLRRRPVVVHGKVVDGPAREAALRAYVGRYPRSRRMTHDAAVVVFATRDG
jgi:hypothetical protein